MSILAGVGLTLLGVIIGAAVVLAAILGVFGQGQ